MKTAILNQQEIEYKIRRIAFQIYESNLNESQIILAGIKNKGFTFAEKIKTCLEEISGINIRLVSLKLDKKNPLNGIEASISSSEYKNESVIIVDDVLNSGSTLIYAVNFFLDQPVKKIQTAVLVDRSHKKYPVKADFVGLSLSTSLSETVKVNFDSPYTAYLLE
ncbi:phosphoribosyltransferase family protein [Mesonia sp. HuA40]|uniref:phosphoribosyltransferase family protein n=1 Tax=Mesonia sp. HuA40 TaxID=2602761 RepID=UPI0011C8E2A2|nr:phosphoribosyltransferase family protein [Mesonia sp. HuA40]TXK72304.1 phosphoribosyltransferase [Mesonia sp. HuA40]